MWADPRWARWLNEFSANKPTPTAPPPSGMLCTRYAICVVGAHMPWFEQNGLTSVQIIAGYTALRFDRPLRRIVLWSAGTVRDCVLWIPSRTHRLPRCCAPATGRTSTSVRGRSCSIFILIGPASRVLHARVKPSSKPTTHQLLWRWFPIEYLISDTPTKFSLTQVFL
jgi:hypothetical protein